ncbi:MAG: hypothetical protein ACK5LS_06715 [Propioniciclava sp.]
MATITRRTLALGATWAAPAVIAAAAAPRLIASPLCTPGGTMAIDWRYGTYLETTQTVGAVTEVIGFTFVPDVWPELTITAATTRHGTSHGSGVNFHRNAQTGGPYTSSITLNYNEWTTTGYPNRTDWTISFSQQVTGLRFAVTDIDWDGPNPALAGLVENRENVTISPVPSASPGLGSAMTGSGTVLDPWRSVGNFNDNNNVTSSIANVAFDYQTTAMTAFTVTAWSTGSPGTQENLFLSTLTIDCPI